MIFFLFKIWGLARPYRWRLWLGVLTGIIAGVFEPMLIVMVVFVYAVIFPTGTGTLEKHMSHLSPLMRNWVETVRDSLSHGVEAHQWETILLVAVIPGIVFLRGLFTYLNVYLLQWVAIRTVTDLRTRLFDHLMGLSAGFFTGTNTGELISRIMNDANTLMGIISNATAVIVKDPVTLISTIAVLLWDPDQRRLTLISMIVLPLCIIPIAIFGRKVRRSAGNMQTHFAELTSVMSESFTGSRVIKAYGLEPTVVEQFRSTSQKMVGQYMRIVRSMEIPGPLTEIFGAVGVALVILYVAVKNQGATDPEQFIEFILLLFTMYRPIKNLARLQNTMIQARAASARVFELLAMENSITEPAQPKQLKAAGAEIEFDGVSFNYETKEVLNNIQLTVKPGQLVALVGASGSGKTTLTNLLMRFYDPLKGSVRIAGTDIREVSTLDLRRQIAVVTQETVLFNETIRRNIELGRPGATNAEIEAAARHAYAHDFIMEKPQGYDTVIGEKGVMLSGGQRQRIAIARAIVRDAPILILDEATNALDSESEHIVQVALEELMKGRTTVCVAHRLSTIQKADVIVVLDQGRIVETGSHEDLLAKNGLYRKLHELQSQGEIK
ncbi:MAG TPA: ABC transporter ATP-binding protein [Verrucomicrobiae bacterium]|jgi:subfamily B ATP-binding cassette protein MsbA|nr:ABC transporter ATP-binding protein [Verrucomicrobiae bacterium]